MNLHKPFGTGYLTDQRDFDPGPDADSRIRSLAIFDLDPPKFLQAMHDTSGTVEVNVDSGETQMMGLADLSDCSNSPLYDGMGFQHIADPGALNKKLVDLAGVSESGGSTTRLKNYLNEMRFRSSLWDGAAVPQLREPHAMVLTLHASASDPLVYMAANLDFDITLVVSKDSVTGNLIVGSFGVVDDFAAFEGYARYQGVTKTSFRTGSPPGNTAIDLLGAATREVSGAVVFDYH